VVENCDVSTTGYERLLTPIGAFRRARWSLAILVVASLVFNAPSAGGRPPDRHPALNRTLRAIISNGVPGAAVIIRRPSGISLITVGARQRGGSSPIGLDDRFRIASVSKAFNAALVMKLAAEHRLRLGDTVARWLPGLLRTGARITLAELLQHTSGLPDYTHDRRFLAALTANPLRPWKPRTLVSYVARQRLLFRPGSRYHYSDTDNVVAGLVIERVTHHTYASVLRQQILRPLGLHATFLPSGTTLPRPFVHGYQFDAGQLEDVTSALSPTGAWASGGMVSDLRDLSRFWQALMGGRLFKQALVSQMLAHLVPGGGQPLGPGRNRSGLGVFAWRMPCGTLYGHTGSFPGYQLLSGATRDGRASIVVLATATATPPRARALQTLAYQQAACQALTTK
jgi:D-alanyl-D-alanine carboxypeptidase